MNNQLCSTIELFWAGLEPAPTIGRMSVGMLMNRGCAAVGADSKSALLFIISVNSRHTDKCAERWPPGPSYDARAAGLGPP